MWVATAGLAFAPGVHAASIINASSADAGLNGGNSSSGSVIGASGGAVTTVTGTLTTRAGTNGLGATAGTGRNYIIPFQLPSLAAGDTFTSASLTVFSNNTTTATMPTTFNADLYAIGVRAAANTLFTTDYFQGALDTRTADTLIQDNFDTPTLSVNNSATLTTGTDGSAALLTYLNTAYAGGTNAGMYVYFRVNPDGYPGDNTAYVYTTVEGASGAGTATSPFITYTTALTSIPEPATLGLSAITFLGMVSRRRA